MKFLSKINKSNYVALLISIIFLIGYLTLSLVKHAHFLTGYDLSVDNQVIWEYSRFLSPISTVHAYAFTPVFWDHVEFIYVLIAPFYWLLADARMFLVLQVIVFILSAIPIFLLCKKYKINNFISYAILISYFTFYGVQNALYSDAHSLVFATSFLAFFIYFLDINRKWPTILFFVLAITSKEDIAFLTFLISFVYLFINRKKFAIFLMTASVMYLFAIFFVYFPQK